MVYKVALHTVSHGIKCGRWASTAIDYSAQNLILLGWLKQIIGPMKIYVSL